MESSVNFLTVAFICLVAVISPGPDFFIVLKNSLSYSRKSGFMTSFGIVMALIIHFTYTIAGIGILIAESPLLYNVIKYAGVAYLFYVGVGSIISSFKKTSSIQMDYSRLTNQITPLNAFMQGFLTNLLNPKVALFLISLFSQFIDPNTPIFVRIEYAAINWIIALAWFLTLSYLVTAQKLLGKINQFRLYIDRVMGGVLTLLGLKLLLA